MKPHAWRNDDDFAFRWRCDGCGSVTSSMGEPVSGEFWVRDCVSFLPASRVPSMTKIPSDCDTALVSRVVES